MADEATTTTTATATAADAAKAAEATEPKFLQLTQEQLDNLITDRLKREQKKAADEKKAEEDARAAADAEKTKSVEDRIAEIQKQRTEDLKAADERTLRAELGRILAGTHNPAAAATLLRAELGSDVDVNDSDALAAAGEAFLKANPYLVKVAGSGGTHVAAPGVDVQTKQGEFFSKEQLAELRNKPEEIAGDPEKYKKYMASIDHHAARA